MEVTMPFCPKCRYEYRPDISVCPDCNEKLLSYLPDLSVSEARDDSANSRNWIPLARFDSQITAEMIIDVLRSKGLPAVLLSGAGYFGLTGQMGLGSFRSIGGAYTVMVSKDSADEAAGEASAILGDEWETVKLI
jgi:hypothetical protein